MTNALLKLELPEIALIICLTMIVLAFHCIEVYLWL